jgi:hypothetical protein
MQNPFRIYHDLPKTIYILFWVQVINRCGDFVIPFLVLFLVTKMGFDFKTVGLIVTISIILQVPGSLIGGKLPIITAEKSLTWFRKRWPGYAFCYALSPPER